MDLIKIEIIVGGECVMVEGYFHEGQQGNFDQEHIEDEFEFISCDYFEPDYIENNCHEQCLEEFYKIREEREIEYRTL